MSVSKGIAVVAQIASRPAFLFAILGLLILFAGQTAMLRDPGTFWHIAAGERMLSTGRVVREDPYSFTFFGRPWIDDQWLSECGMALAYRLAGWDGLLVTTATLLAAFYAWIGGRFLQAGVKLVPAALVLSLVLLVGSPQFHVRPLLLTIVFLGITYALLVDVENGRTSSRQLWWLVPLFILWTNVHGGVLAGIGTAGLCLAGWLVFGLPHNEAPSSRLRQAAELAVLGLLLLLVTLVNPYGLELPLEWLQTLTMPLPNMIDEHRPLCFGDPIGIAVLTLLALYAVAFLGTLHRRPRVAWFLPLIWFVFAVLRVRNAPLLGVVSAIALADMLPHSRLGEWLERRGMLGERRSFSSWHLAILPAVVLIAAASLQVSGLPRRVHLRSIAKLDPARWPVELLPKLQAITAANNREVRIFNDLNFGGFLIFHQPGMPIFIDDRCSLYGSEFLMSYDQARRSNPAQIETWRQQYGYCCALVERGNAFDTYLERSKVWKLFGRTDTASLYRWDMGVSSESR